MKNQENLHEHQKSQGIWQLPLGYAGSFLIASGIVIWGFVFELVWNGMQVPAPHRPYNIIILFSAIVFLLTVHLFFGKTAFVKWFSSIPCSISAIAAYALLTLLLGFVRQENEDMSPVFKMLGLNHLKNSWPFLFIEIYLLVTLGFTVLRRSYPLTSKNLGFLMNHAGLWLTLVAAGLGSGDIQRLKVRVYENGPFVNAAYSKGHQILILPFSLKLLDFNMEMYNPGIALADTLSGNMIEKHGVTIPLIEKGSEYHLQDWNIRVLEMMPHAIRKDKGYVSSENPVSASVAYVSGTNVRSGDSIRGWLCSGSLFMRPAYLKVGGSQVLFITKPEPRRYSSSMVFRDKQGKMDSIVVEVNKPYKRNRWSLYQLSYDEKMGQSSNMSEIEAVYDPWLPLVYIGIILMIAGACYLFWLGRGIKSNE
jgi:hypothetical protein